MTVQQALEFKRIRDERKALYELTQAQNAELSRFNEELEKKVKERTEELEQSYQASIDVFANLIQQANKSLGAHHRKMADIARSMAIELEFDEETQTALYQAALLHGIGLITLPQDIQQKPYSLMREEELERFHRHPVIAETSLCTLEPLKLASQFIRSQRELINGNGFPDGLAGRRVPLPAQALCALLDYYELQQGRLLAQTLDAESAFEYVQSHAGKRYDETITQAFIPVVQALGMTGEAQTQEVLAPSELKTGMILTQDLCSPDGVLLLSKGHVLRFRNISRLENLEENLGCRFEVYVRQADKPNES